MKDRQGSFYWYDLETTGVDSRWDRIVQFAGLRTDADLNEIGDVENFYVSLPDDVLPNPDAALVTGITPPVLAQSGRSEWSAIRRIEELLGQPGTCGVGYNSFRFDDEFVRQALYRNLCDPYAREWRNGNSRWDLIPLVRATGALRPEGIEWPTDETGLPVYRLEGLTAANGIDHGSAHDALSDVRATVGLARLLRQQQPRLFDYYLSLRDKRAVRALLEPYGARLCVHVSAMYPREQYGIAPIVSVGRHPTNTNSIIVADLSRDIEPLLEWPEERIRTELYKPGNRDRPPLKEIRINRAPFVAGIEVLTDANWQRSGCRKRDVQERQRRLARPGVAQKLLRVFTPRAHEAPIDVEAALYAGFIDDADRSRGHALARAIEAGSWEDLDYSDARLKTLAFRLKARCFPDWLEAGEKADWDAFVRDKLTSDGPWLALDAYRERIDVLRAERGLNPGPDADRASSILDELAVHGARIAERYAI